MLTLRLPEALEKRLTRLATVTGRSKSFYVREAILKHLDDLEDRLPDRAHDRARTQWSGKGLFLRRTGKATCPGRLKCNENALRRPARPRGRVPLPQTPTRYSQKKFCGGKIESPTSRAPTKATPLVNGTDFEHL